MRLQNVFTGLAVLALAALVFIVVRSLTAPKPQVQVIKLEKQASGQMPQIYVARDSMKVGTFINAGDLEPRDWPEQAILATQLRVDQVPASDLAGAVVRDQIAKGEPILREKLVRPGDRGFLAAVLLPGMRAVTVPLDNITGHSGLLQPGDRVDVILTQDIESKEASAARAHVGETIVRAVRVVAVNAVLNPAEKSENVDDHPKSATLEVTPKQSEVIAVALKLGTLSLALRSLPATESDELEDDLATTGADLTKPTDPTWGGDVSKAFAGGASVQVMRGSGDQQQ